MAKTDKWPTYEELQAQGAFDQPADPCENMFIEDHPDCSGNLTKVSETLSEGLSKTLNGTTDLADFIMFSPAGYAVGGVALFSIIVLVIGDRFFSRRLLSRSRLALGLAAFLGLLAFLN